MHLPAGVDLTSSCPNSGQGKVKPGRSSQLIRSFGSDSTLNLAPSSTSLLSCYLNPSGMLASFLVTAPVMVHVLPKLPASPSPPLESCPGIAELTGSVQLTSFLPTRCGTVILPPKKMTQSSRRPSSETPAADCGAVGSHRCLLAKWRGCRQDLSAPLPLGQSARR